MQFPDRSNAAVLNLRSGEVALNPEPLNGY